MKQPIRAFSIGLFTAGVIMLVAFYFSDIPEPEKVVASPEEMIENLKSQGYRVISEEEYIAFSLQDKNDKTAEATEDADDSKKEKVSDTEKQTVKKKETTTKDKQEKSVKKDNTKKKKDTVKKYTLKIVSGMPSSEIADTLAQNDIIKDANKFIKYLEDEGYSERVQLGNFKVNSDMSFYELAEAITR